VIDSRGDLAVPVHRDARRKFSVRDGTADLLGRVQQVGGGAGPNLLKFLERSARSDPNGIRTHFEGFAALRNSAINMRNAAR
jgi:hypothetical protein